MLPAGTTPALTRHNKHFQLSQSVTRRFPTGPLTWRWWGGEEGQRGRGVREPSEDSWQWLITITFTIQNYFPHSDQYWLYKTVPA